MLAIWLVIASLGTAAPFCPEASGYYDLRNIILSIANGNPKALRHSLFCGLISLLGITLLILNARKKRKPEPEKVGALRKLLSLVMDSKGLALLCFVMGFRAYAKDKKKKAEKYFRKSARMFPTLKAFVMLGNCLVDGEKFPEAKQCYDKALAISSREAKPDNKFIAMAYMGLAFICNKLNDHWIAVTHYKKALDLYSKDESCDQDTHNEIRIFILNNLATSYGKLEIFAEAERVYLEIFRIEEQLIREDPETYLPSFAHTCLNIGEMYAEQEKTGPAEKYYRLCLDAYGRAISCNAGALRIPYIRALIQVAVFYQKFYYVRRLMMAHANRALEILAACGDTAEVAELRRQAVEITNYPDRER